MKITEGFSAAWKRFHDTPTQKKVMFVSASVVTVALLSSLPVLAWFSYRRQIMKLQKVEAPNTLILSAAHREDVTCFEIDGIDADEIAVDVYGNNITRTVDGETEDVKITYKDYVFCVTGDAVDKFTIQLAYTTNNPFTYEVYAAKELTDSELQTSLSGVAVGTPIDYVKYTIQNDPVTGMPALSGDEYHLNAGQKNAENVVVDKDLYYRIDTSVTDPTSGTNAAVAGKYIGRYLNSTDGSAADNDDASLTYQKKAYDLYTNIEADAKPVYWQANNVSAFPGKVNSMKDPFSRHFILRVKWDAGSLKNTEKETDIIYITVKATS